MKNITKAIFHSEKFAELRTHVGDLKESHALQLHGITGSLFAFVVAAVFEKRKHPVLVIAQDEEQAEKLRDDCALLIGEGSVRYFGARPAHQGQSLDVSSSIAQIETLKALAQLREPLVVIAPPQAMAEKVPHPKQFRDSIVELHSHSTTNFQQLIDRLQELGFERKDFVESYGDIAVRGGIIDIFPYVGENPIRVEFWGDEIESIREFDVLSQRSIRELESASIVPSIARDGETQPDQLSASLFDYLSQETIIIWDEPLVIEREIDELLKEGIADAFTFNELFKRSKEFPCIIHSLFTPQHPQIQDLHQSTVINFESLSQPSFNGSISVLVDAIEKHNQQGYTIHLTCDTESEAKRLKELIDEFIKKPEEISAKLSENEMEELSTEAVSSRALAYEIVSETTHAGFIYPSAKLAVFTEHEIFGRIKRRGIGKRRRFKGFSQKELQQLKRGDYVVHIDHGIGRFDGLSKIQVAGVEQEVMRLLFLENDVLYVNLSFINRVQKYSSQEGHMPKLNKLGSAEWERMKARAKRRIKDIARDIIALYAKRKHEKGFAFSPDTHWQRELEASFMYEDTIDQAGATSDVKRDMENTSPMDRLICGDVGFGKTEVAVRAAFKAVMDGKQVGVLVPTTILALQHYNTFQDRLSRYTTRVENITRFKSKKEQKSVVEGLAKGSVDIIIGTHRLLSKDIAFKDLGLLIIDEEHRFGVAAKEKLRQLKATVDTLALTATPIPRTLHFSLIGARDLSLIATPPRNRLPILTEIIPGDASGKQTQWHVCREAILKELHRGGQTYFVHDRVQNIDAIATQVKSYVPEARIHVAHGQMTGHQLEKTMLDFLQKKYDVLIATKIIESGLDIPNVNTIIINRADRFGLAELYQLRGRVGRSNVQAYAYLFTPPLGAMPKPTLRRLQAIEEFTELGSGFNLAMRDLEIRGAGNLLGGEQTGFIMEMGFEMYERVLREAVEELKQEEFEDIFRSKEGRASTTGSAETVIESDIDALIPDFYIESDAERLDVYRRLYNATTSAELVAIREELRDRFGEYPEEVEHLVQLVELRQIALQAGFSKVSLKKSGLVVTLPNQNNEAFYGVADDQNAPFQQLVKRIAQEKMNTVKLQQEGKTLTLQFTNLLIDGTKDRLKEAKKRLEEICRTQ
jgi:transcription-repair coupling factor (superfamily II helicase)